MAYTTINKSGDYFNTKLYTGNASTNAITGVGFQPDLVWLKNRGSTGDHLLQDVVRGANFDIRTNSNGAQSVDNGTTHLNSFDSDGFTLGGSGSHTNANTHTYASWNWKANGTGSANTNGSINTTYTTANTTAGFSICSYTGTGANATVGHGLGVAPEMIIVKKLNGSTDWRVYHKDLNNTHVIYLNTTQASESGSTVWNNTSPTNSVFSIGTQGGVNASGDTYIAYCFAEKTGYSKFGSYTGNGNTDGTFVYTGFKPSFVMTKRTDSTSDWLICDSGRNVSNVVNKKLFANLSQAEDSYDSFDFVSNGLKIRSSGTGHNASGGTFIYMAFAEAPLVGTNNVPCTAR